MNNKFINTIVVVAVITVMLIATPFVIYGYFPEIIPDVISRKILEINVRVIAQKIKDHNPSWSGTLVNGDLAHKSSPNTSVIYFGSDLRERDLILKGNIDNLNFLYDMPRLDWLALRNITATDFSALYVNMPNHLELTSLNLNDLDFMQRVELENLAIYCCKVNDYSGLKNIYPKYLSLQGSNFSDLTQLPQSGILSLDLSDTMVTDLKPLEKYRLNTLSIDNLKVSDIEPLRNMPLDYLSMQNTNVQNINVLGSTRIKTLYMQNTKIEALSGLSGKSLTFLLLKGTKFDHLSKKQLLDDFNLSVSSLTKRKTWIINYTHSEP